MKFVIIILLLLITGCSFSGDLEKSCTKVVNSNGFNETITYKMYFKEDINNKIVITYDYEDSNNENIKAIKSSFESKEKFLKNIVVNKLIDNDNQYKIEYVMDMNKIDQIEKDEYFIKEKYSEQIKILKEKEWKCE